MTNPINLSPNGLLGVIVALFILLMLGIGFTCMTGLSSANLKYTQNKLQLGKEY
jgi:hypothetical protein